MTKRQIRAARAAANPTITSGRPNKGSILLAHPMPNPSAPGPVRRSRALSRSKAPENGLWGRPVTTPYGGWR